MTLPLKTLCALFASATLMSGCEDVRSGHVASDLEREAARDLVAQLGAIAAQPVDAHGLLTAANFMPVLTLVVPAGTPVAMPAGDLASSDPASSDDGCLLATPTSATYSQCEIADHVVDGTWSAQLSRIHAELVDVFVVGPGMHGSIAVEANLSGSSELSGQLEAGLMWSVGDGDYVVDAVLRIDGLVLEGPRCATAGTISITAAFAAASDAASGAASGGPHGDAPATTTLWFGPGCHDVLIAH